MKRALLTFVWVYVGALVVAVTANVLIGLTTEYGIRTSTGCNFFDAMVIGVECRGFIGAKEIELFLNWSLWLVYGPMFAFVAPWFLIVALLLWAPPAFLVFTYLRRRNATSL